MSSPDPEERREQYALWSKLLMKKTEFGEFRRHTVVAQYGTRGLENGEGSWPAQLHIFKEDCDLTNSLQAPEFSLDLETAQVYMVRASPSNNRKFGTGTACRSVNTSRSFSVSPQEGVSYQFRASDDWECQLWINMLKFLIIFPFSSVPQEPGCDTTVFDEHTCINPQTYHTDAAWPVYIPDDDVGGRCGVGGMRVLTLEGKVPGRNEEGILQLYSMADTTTAVFSLKHNTIRCTGKMGRWIYVEVGTRGRGGPGLLWMYFGSKERAVWMKDVLYMFLVKQQVTSTMSLYALFPLDAPLSGPPIPPRPISQARLSNAHSSPSSSNKWSKPPHHYAILESTPPTQTSQRKGNMYDTIDCPVADSDCQAMAPAPTKCKIRDYNVLEASPQPEYRKAEYQVLDNCKPGTQVPDYRKQVSDYHKQVPNYRKAGPDNHKSTGCQVPGYRKAGCQVPVPGYRKAGCQVPDYRKPGNQVPDQHKAAPGYCKAGCKVQDYTRAECTVPDYHILEVSPQQVLDCQKAWYEVSDDHEAEYKVQDRAEHKVPDYHILEVSPDSNKHCYAKVNKKKKPETRV